MCERERECVCDYAYVSAWDNIKKYRDCHISFFLILIFQIYKKTYKQLSKLWWSSMPSYPHFYQEISILSQWFDANEIKVHKDSFDAS